MNGILKLAYKLPVNDKPKFVALLVGITFAVFLMIQMTSMFAGILNRSSSTVINIGAKVWIMDPAVITFVTVNGPVEKEAWNEFAQLVLYSVKVFHA